MSSGAEQVRFDDKPSCTSSKAAAMRHSRKFTQINIYEIPTPILTNPAACNSL